LITLRSSHRSARREIFLPDNPAGNRRLVYLLVGLIVFCSSRVYFAYAANAAVTLPAGTTFAVTCIFDTFTLHEPELARSRALLLRREAWK